MYSMKQLNEFYKNKKVLITGNTGFKGSWLTLWLNSMGAKVIGISDVVDFDNGIFNLCGLQNKIKHIKDDIRDYHNLFMYFQEHQPDIVFHLAAQPLVRKSYDIPRQTFETNTQGTINVLECIRHTKSVKSAVMVTTDKVYKNKEWYWGYRENDELGGDDPYSASKACAEMVIKSYYNSFFKNSQFKIATVRAGNVIGGGDWAEDRIMTDIINSYETGNTLRIRNPYSTRPFQFVLEPLRGYLMTGQALYENKIEFESFNFGPDKSHIVTVRTLVESMAKQLNNLTFEFGVSEDNKKESNLLSLDSTKAQIELGWKPKLTFEQTISFVAQWYNNYKTMDVQELTERQVKHYESLL